MFDWDALPALFPTLRGQARWLQLLQVHAGVLEQHADSVRTTAVSGGDAIFRHYAESLELLRLVEQRRPTGPIVDVGPGGGFPGLVFAAVLEDAPVTLVEPLKKRARLLELAVEAMALTNVAIVALRAEEAGRTELRESAALVTARAVAPLPELVEYCAPLAATGGLIALPKGSGLQAETAAASAALDALRCEVEDVVPMRPEVSATPHVLLLRKTGSVPDEFPRRPGIPRKRPIKAEN
jgi:16S rRNA (guanine527-N7)-methyltransferase